MVKPESLTSLMFKNALRNLGALELPLRKSN